VTAVGVSVVAFSQWRRAQLEDFRLDQLMQDACDWVGDYLKNNSKVEQSERTLCNGIGKK